MMSCVSTRQLDIRRCRGTTTSWFLEIDDDPIECWRKNWKIALQAVPKSVQPVLAIITDSVSERVEVEEIGHIEIYVVSNKYLESKGNIVQTASPL